MVYLVINKPKFTFEAFNSVKAAAQYLNIDPRTIKNYLDKDKLVRKEYVIVSAELQKFTRKHKKGYNVSLGVKKVHNNDF